MKDFIKVLRRFVPPYKRQLILSFIFNILSAVMNVMQFGLIIPILNILFKTSDEVYEFFPWSKAGAETFIQQMEYFIEAAKNNFYFFINKYIGEYGESSFLLMLSVALVIMALVNVPRNAPSLRSARWSGLK